MSIWIENWNPTIVALWILREPVLSHWKTQTQKNTHTYTHWHRRVQRACRGVSLLVSCRLGGGSCSWHAKSWRLPKPRGTVSIVRWALFSGYNHSSELWKHILNPNSPCDWRDFTFILTDKHRIVLCPLKKPLTFINFERFFTCAKLEDSAFHSEVLTNKLKF